MPGDLDLSFGGTGVVTTDLSSGNDFCYGVAIQNDGRIVIAGQAFQGSGTGTLLDFAVVRYESNGTLDTSFNGTGKVTTDFGRYYTDDGGYSVAVQSDGKIVVAGATQINRDSYGFAIVRYDTNGNLDTSFNGSGIVTTSFGTLGTAAGGKSMALQSDGKIVVAGYLALNNFVNLASFEVVRYNSNGSLDTSFNGTGTLSVSIAGNWNSAYGVVLQTDGKIVVAGECQIAGKYKFGLFRCNANGTLDTSFNGTGMVTTAIGNGDDRAYSVALQADGKIVVAGSSYNGSNDDFALVRYNADGSLDTSFNGSGKVTTDFGGGYEAGRSLVIQSDGRIVVTGGDLTALARYNTDGSLDTSFNGTGKVKTGNGSSFAGGYGVALQTDGQIVVVGTASGSGTAFAVARYEGVPEPSSVILMISSGWMFLLQRRRVSAR